jgi:hypothetical protein
MLSVKSHELVVRRSSFCAADDCNAPHELVLSSASPWTVGRVAAELSSNYFPVMQRVRWFAKGLLEFKRGEPVFLVPEDTVIDTSKPLARSQSVELEGVLFRECHLDFNLMWEKAPDALT